MTSLCSVSYLCPRDPSILGPGRPLPTSRKCLNSFLVPEQPRDPVQVYLRVKPLPNVSLKPEEPTFTIADPKTLVAKHLKTTSRGKSQMTQQYSFTEIFNGDTDQKKVFERCAHESVREFVSGKNALMFAYGTTNAGKTHTMMGSTEQPGIIPRSINVVFNSVGDKLSGSCRLKPERSCQVVEQDEEAQAADNLYKKQLLEWSLQMGETFSSGRSTLSQASDTASAAANDSTVSDFISCSFREMQGNLHDETAVSVAASDDLLYSVWISFAEVYNESIFDLLDAPGQRNALGLGLDAQNTVFIKGLRHVSVSSGDEAYQVLLYGQNNLRSAPTNLNRTSSRSHCIFTMKLVRTPNTHAPTQAGVSTFSFCDLAGSERCKKTMNAGVRLKESQNINTSLVVLGRCITNIRDNQKLRLHDRKPVPFRDSKLTRLFQRALLGHERVSMVVNVSPEPLLFSETCNVLTFSAIARQIVLVPLRQKKHPSLATRFSVIATKHCKRQTIAWDNPDEEDGDESSSSRHDNSIAVSRLVAQLRRDLEAERARNLTLETNLRRELTDRFKEILESVEENHKKQFADAEERHDNILDWRMQRMQKHYDNKMHAAKRRRSCSDDEDMEETVLDPQVKEEEEDLGQEVEALQELNADALQINCQLTAEKSRLQFELADANTKLSTANKIIEVAQASPDADGWSPLVADLQAALATENDKNQKLKTLLDEARMEFDNLREQNASLEKDLADAELELAEKETANEDLVTALAECQEELVEKKSLLVEARAQAAKLNAELGARVKQLTEQLASLQDMNRTVSSTASGLEEVCARKDVEVTELEREVKHQLQLNRDKCQEVRALEREFKDTVKAMNGAEAELQVQQDRVKQITMQWQCEVNNLEAQLERERNNSELVSQQANENKRLALATLQEENEQLNDKIARMAADMASFEERRDKQFKLYEDMLRQKKEEVDCQKREVRSLQEVLYKNTPTPKKDQLNQLKEDVRLKDQKINELAMELTRLKVSKPHSSAVNSKENAEPCEAPASTKRNGRQTRKTPGKQIEASGSSRVLIKEEPDSCEKEVKSRTRKKLFTHKESLLDLPLSDPFPVSEQYTSPTPPAEQLMRTLRSRRN